MSIDPTPRNDRPPRPVMTLSTSSSLSLALVIGVVSGVAGGAVWATRIEMRLERIEGHILDATRDRWTARDMERWVEMLGDRVDIWRFQMEAAGDGSSIPVLRIPEVEEARH